MRYQRILLLPIIMALMSPLLPASEKSDNFYFRGSLYMDWFGAQYEGLDFSSRFSLRLKTEMYKRRGQGWNLLLDTRSRLQLGQEGTNRFLLYDARLNYESKESPLYISLGQMNLYDTAGIGQLLGGTFGYKLRPDLLIGGYAGLESSVYPNRISRNHTKSGFFARYLGSRGKRLSLSFNNVRFSGKTERRYLYMGTLLPLNRVLILYSSLEYETESHVRKQDRLSRIFANLRWDPLKFLNIMAHFSSGKGLDFHRYVIERSQNPVLNDQALERFYYSQQYGLRLTLKPSKRIRLHVARQESEQRDRNVRNHTWRFGASASNLAGAGFSAYGSYTINRGEISEMDSYYLSLSKDIGRMSLNVSFSNTFNGIRFDDRTGSPEIIHLDDYKTLSTSIYYTVSRMVALSTEYEYFLQEKADQHLLFVRLILRK
jgi:hypothetical protein